MALLNEKLLNGFLNKQYPIGKTELFLDNEDHSNYMGFTWQLDAIGKAIVGIDTSDTDFNVIGKTGGSKYLQEHKHAFRVIKDNNSNSGGGLPKANNSQGDNSGWSDWQTENNKLPVGNVVGVTTGNSGNLQPYKVFAVWVRIA